MSFENEHEMIIDKLANIRDTYFDESDMAAEGHGMEDMIGDPYSVLIYTENKLKRLIEENKQLEEDVQFYKEQYQYAEKERSEWVKRYNEESSQKVKYRNAFECLYEKISLKNN